MDKQICHQFWQSLPDAGSDTDQASTDAARCWAELSHTALTCIADANDVYKQMMLAR